MTTTKHPLEKGWLAALLDRELARYDAPNARTRLPPDVVRAGASPVDLAPAARILVARSLRRRLGAAPATPRDAFLDDVGTHVGLALDLALLRGDPFVRARRRAELAAFLAAAVGDHDAALDAHAEEPGGASDRAVARAVRAAEGALQSRFHPPGDPTHGLPLYAGATAVLRRRLARVVAGYHRDGTLRAEALARHGAYAEGESALLAEALAGLLAAAHPPDAATRAVRVRQLARLGLSGAALRAAREAILAPRAPDELARAAPPRVRAFLLEQLFLVQLRAAAAGDGAARFVDLFVAAAELDPEAVVEARIEAAAQHGDHETWFQAFDLSGSVDWHAVAAEVGSATDNVVERVSSAVTENLGAMVTEIRETGELGQLLAKAAAGTTLTADEKRKVRAQLIDLAKAVPALAIFAAPGGALLLPLLAKLLPFNVMPSAWDRVGAAKPPKPPSKPPPSA